MERLDKLSLGIREQNTGEDMDHPPVASPTTADHTAPSLDALQASFDAPWQTLIHLSPTVKWEQDLNLSQFILHSWDLPLGALLHTMPPISGLRQHVQMPRHLDAKLDFSVDFCLPSPIASSQPLRLPDSRWELGTSIQTLMVKSLAQMVTHL